MEENIQKIIDKITDDLKNTLKESPNFTGYLKLNFHFGEYASLELHKKEKRNLE